MSQENNKQWYIKYFTHMQEEDKKCMLGGMAWDDIGWHLYRAIDENKLFTRQELAEMFPDLLGYLLDPATPNF